MQLFLPLTAAMPRGRRFRLPRCVEIIAFGGRARWETIPLEAQSPAATPIYELT